MKNGLLLLLLMVALVAMTATAGAMAPVVKTLPAVIIGDNGDIGTGDATTAAHLLKYVNVFNLASPGVIERRTNPEDPAKLHVWYTVSVASGATTLKVSNAANLVTPMTPAEASALQATGARPTGKQINTTSDFWLSLIEDAPGVGKTSAANAAAATADANGATAAELAATVANNPKTVTLYAVDVDSVTSKVGTGAFDVYSLLNTADGYSQRVINIFNNTFTGSADGWTAVPGSGSKGTLDRSGTALTMKGAATLNTNGNVNYDKWAIQVPAGSSQNMDGMIFRATAHFTGNASSATLMPQYRLFAQDDMFLHGVSANVTSTNAAGDNGTVENMPSASTADPIENRLYWAVPTDLTDYSDTGYLNGGLAAGDDKRDYVLSFELVQIEANDTGMLSMEDMVLDVIPRPADVTPAVQWGSATGAIAFTDATNGFADAGAMPGGLPSSLAEGKVTVAAGGVTLDFGTATAVKAYRAANPVGASVMPAYASGKLMRTTWNVSCAGNIPVGFRLLAATQTAASFGAKASVDYFTPAFGAHQQYKSGTGHTVLAGTPKAGGSTIETYFFSGVAPAGALVMYPSAEVFQQDFVGSGATANWNGWGRPQPVTISAIAVEVMDAD